MQVRKLTRRMAVLDNLDELYELSDRFEQNFLIFKLSVISGIDARMTPEERELMTAEKLLEDKYPDWMLKHQFSRLPVPDDLWRCDISTWPAEKMDEYTKAYIDVALRERILMRLYESGGATPRC